MKNKKIYTILLIFFAMKCFSMAEWYETYSDRFSDKELELLYPLLNAGDYFVDMRIGKLAEKGFLKYDEEGNNVPEPFYSFDELFALRDLANEEKKIKKIDFGKLSLDQKKKIIRFSLKHRNNSQHAIGVFYFIKKNFPELKQPFIEIAIELHQKSEGKMGSQQNELIGARTEFIEKSYKSMLTTWGNDSMHITGIDKNGVPIFEKSSFLSLLKE